MQPFEARAGNVGEDGQGSAGGEGDRPACTTSPCAGGRLGIPRQTRVSRSALDRLGAKPPLISREGLLPHGRDAFGPVRSFSA